MEVLLSYTNGKCTYNYKDNDGLENFADEMATYHALDSSVHSPHELHQGGLVVQSLALQAEGFELLQVLSI